MAETLTVQEFQGRYGGKSWTLSSIQFIPVVDRASGLIEHYEHPVQPYFSGWQQIKDQLFRPDQDPLYVESVPVGPRVRRYRIGHEPSGVRPSFKLEAIDAVEVGEDDVSITYEGCGAFLGVFPGCVHPKYVHSITVHALSQSLSKVTIHFKLFEKVTLGVDDTDNREAGATVFLCDNFMIQRGETEDVQPLYLTPVHLYPKCEFKTTNNCTSAMAFAVRPHARDTLVSDAMSWFRQYSLSEHTVMSVRQGISTPPGLRDFTRRAKLRLVPKEEALEVAQAHVVQMLSPHNGGAVTGKERAIVGALAAHGLADNISEANRHLVSE